MTTLSTPSIQRPPPRTISSSDGRPSTRPVSQLIQQIPRSIPQQVLVDQSVGVHSANNLSRPVAKRRKLDTIDQRSGDRSSRGALLERSPGACGQQAASLVAQPVRPKAHTETSFLASEDDEVVKVPFPIRFGSIPHRKLDITGRNPEIVRKEEVQDKPYNLEIPKIAPQYGNHGKSPGVE